MHRHIPSATLLQIVTCPCDTFKLKVSFSSEPTIRAEQDLFGIELYLVVVKNRLPDRVSNVVFYKSRPRGQDWPVWVSNKGCFISTFPLF